MKFEHTVYCLFKPHEGQPFYFGMTGNPKAREVAHKLKHGKDIYFCILHIFPCARSAGASERHYIRRYEALGVPLLNVDKTQAHEEEKRKRREFPYNKSKA